MGVWVNLIVFFGFFLCGFFMKIDDVDEGRR